MADDIERIERNVRKMIDQGAPKPVIDRYLRGEGYTPQQFKNRRKQPKPSFRETLEANVRGVFDRPRINASQIRQEAGNRPPGMVNELISKGPAYAAQTAISGIGGLPHAILEQAPAAASNAIGGLLGGRTDVEPTNIFPSASQIQEKMTEMSGASPERAETPLGKVAQSALTGAAVMPVAPVLGAISGGLSETGGLLAEGTKYEVPARVAGAAGPFLGQALFSAVRPTPGLTVGKAFEGLSEADRSDVVRLMYDAQRSGSPITTAEAIAQVTGRKSPLVAQRAVEESGLETPGVERVQQMMTQRPQANRSAFENTVPPVRSPTTEIAPRVRDVAQGRLDAERALTNARTKPLYETTVDVGLVDASKLAAISDDPAISMAIQGARKDPIRFGDLRNLPDNHMRVLDAAKKYLDEYYVEGMGGLSRASITSAKGRLLNITDEAYPDYAAARLIQQRRMRTREEPLKRSATGRVADQETLSGQYRKVFDDPMEVSADQVEELVKDLSRADPQLASDFVSRYLTRLFNKAQKPKTSKETGASTFANQVRGDVDVLANVEAAVKSLPDGAQRWDALNRLLNVFEAQGRRLPSGSPTQVKQEFARKAREGFIPRLSRLNQGLADRFGDWRYGRDLEGMARLLVMPPNELGRLMMSRPQVVAPTAVEFSVQQQ